MGKFINKSDLKLINNKLVRGDKKRIAEIVNKTPAAVSKVLLGQSQSLDIIHAAIQVIEKRQESCKKLSEKIKSI